METPLLKLSLDIKHSLNQVILMTDDVILLGWEIVIEMLRTWVDTSAGIYFLTSTAFIT